MLLLLARFDGAWPVIAPGQSASLGGTFGQLAINVDAGGASLTSGGARGFIEAHASFAAVADGGALATIPVIYIDVGGDVVSDGGADGVRELVASTSGGVSMSDGAAIGGRLYPVTAGGTSLSGGATGARVLAVIRPVRLGARSQRVALVGRAG